MDHLANLKAEELKSERVLEVLACCGTSVAVHLAMVADPAAGFLNVKRI